MSSIASYMVIKDGNKKFYGTGYGGNGLINDLFAGPELATQEFESEGELEDTPEDEFGDADEATALVDWDQRVLIWTSQYCDFPVQQRLYNKLLAEIWEGWTIRCATRGLIDILDHAGIPFDVPQDASAVEDDDNDTQPNVENILERVDVSEAQQVEGPVAYHEGLQSGCWLSIRDQDGNYRDYFGWDGSSFIDSLCAGEPIIEHLLTLPHCQSLPSELVAIDGAVIDLQDRTLWRWEGSRCRWRWQDRSFTKVWGGWTIKDLPGGWREQMRLTQRDPSELAGDERQILGMTLAELIDISAIESQKKVLKVIKFVQGLRVGCVVATAALAIIGGGLAYWWNSITTGVLICLLFVLSASLTKWLWKKTKFLSAKFKPSQTIEEKVESMNGILSRLGYPSIEQLQALGEFPKNEEDEEE